MSSYFSGIAVSVSIKVVEVAVAGVHRMVPAKSHSVLSEGTGLRRRSDLDFVFQLR